GLRIAPIDRPLDSSGSKLGLPPLRAFVRAAEVLPRAESRNPATPILGTTWLMLGGRIPVAILARREKADTGVHKRAMGFEKEDARAFTVPIVVGAMLT